jgi:DNA-binding transcriptional MerR regulator
LDKGPDAFRTISEVADEIDVPQHVLRFWESRFAQLRPMKRGGGRRFYRPDDVDLLRGVRHLLYGEGYTIRGVQRILREQGAGFVQNVWRAGAEPPPRQAEDDDEEEESFAKAPSRERVAPDLSAFSLNSPPITERAPPIAERAVERREPQLAPPSPPTAPPRGIGAQSQQKLRAALDELVECQRLIERVLTVGDS